MSSKLARMTTRALLVRPVRPFAVTACLVAAALVPAPSRAGSPGGGPLALPRPASFEAAVAALEGATGVKAEPVELGGKPVAAAEGVAFAVDAAVAARLLAGSHVTFREAGLYLFRLERSFGLAGEKDPLVLLRTADRSAVVRRVGTASAKAGVTTERIVAWLDALAKDAPYDLTEIGVDYLAGRFVRAPQDPAAIARRCVELAPDLVAARASTLDLLVEEIRSARTLYLIW